MNFMVRPSKSFLFDFLENNLKHIHGSAGLDAGSSNFKNLRMFKTKKYYGLDINLDSLRNGLAKYKTENCFAILADLTHLAQLPTNSLELVVSTNTLYSLDIDKRLMAIKNLSALVSPQGKFILEFSLDKSFNQIKDLLTADFKHLQIIYYKNIFSLAYEKIFERHGYLGSHPIAGLRPFRLFAWLLSRLEFLTSFTPRGNQHVIFICSHKENPVAKNEFNLSGLPQLESRIYKLI